MNRLKPHYNVEGVIKEGAFYNQVVDAAMKARRIILIGVAVFQRNMRIRVMGHQCVDRDLGTDRQRKQRQKTACQ